MKQTTLFFCLVLISLVLVLVGCGPKETPAVAPQESETSTTSESTPSAPSPEAAAPVTETEPQRETPAIETPLEAPPEGLLSRSTGALAALESYRYTTRVEYEGTDGDEIDAGSIEIIGEYASPDREHVTWTDLATGEGFEIIRIGDTAWMYEDEEWIEVPQMAVESIMQVVFLFAPVYAWEGMAGELETGSNFVGKEVVNGVSTLHYSSDYAGWEERFEGDLHEASGEIWIAEEGFPVRSIFTASGIDEDGNQGSVEWRMDLTNVNQAISIEPPAM
ncbi:hypothetical protein KAW44_03850 [Candidatus Bipolaricaulota bacterium]|nr:hypothetical protein [Candidatus Bipolaricaulota bacterium]